MDLKELDKHYRYYVSKFSEAYLLGHPFYVGESLIDNDATLLQNEKAIRFTRYIVKLGFTFPMWKASQ